MNVDDNNNIIFQDNYFQNYFFYLTNEEKTDRVMM